MNKKLIIALLSWLFAIWTSYVFLFSLLFKFDQTATEPKHIFSTIGRWMSETLNPSLGEFFTAYGQYLIGFSELVTSLLLLAPIVFVNKRLKFHILGSLFAVFIMVGAIFFHLFTPLGWVPTWCENGVIYTTALQCQGGEVSTDTGLANAALSILVLGIVVVYLNTRLLKCKKVK